MVRNLEEVVKKSKPSSSTHQYESKNKFYWFWIVNMNDEHNGIMYGSGLDLIQNHICFLLFIMRNLWIFKQIGFIHLFFDLYLNAVIHIFSTETMVSYK
jgi:hypothetical protein